MQDINAYMSEKIHIFRGGSLCMFGDWFGGRAYDTFYKPVSFSYIDGILTLNFTDNEKLTVWSPRNVSIYSYELKIHDADLVRWEWYCYGREQIAENRRFHDYILTADGSVNTSYEYMHSPSFSKNEPAVLIISMGNK